jgi:hypothetical protein
MNRVCLCTEVVRGKGVSVVCVCLQMMSVYGFDVACGPGCLCIGYVARLGMSVD